MNDLRPLHRHHDAQPGPTPEGVDRMRARLTAHMDASAKGAKAMRTKAAPSTKRRLVRPAWGLAFGATATAGALAVALVAGGGNGAPSHGATSHDDSARTVLLTAAEHAETGPTGKYWRVKTTDTRANATVYAEWITLDGQRWVAYRNPRPEPGTNASELHKAKGLGPIPVSVLGPNPALSALIELPAQPKALRALAERNVPKQNKAESVTEALVGLLTDQPVPPKVRAAAFRALADVPGVRMLGRTTDPRGRKGTALAFTYTTPRGAMQSRLVIDTGSSQVLAETLTGSKEKPFTHTRVYLATGWTDESPRIP